ncbi:MAG: GNAT family N-acetyltransferase [Chitinophagaceae bacterium]|nr:MAG: GNAT family N-acetyltransferase [Chitinophagaceae bacterium]
MYKSIHNQVQSQGSFSIVPLRSQDRYDIMQWRNEQIFHLRQNKLLTKEEQDRYFDEVVAKQFLQDNPPQLLFSFLQNGECIGYGGLVHINYIDRNAEISFLMNTKLEEAYFEQHWQTYLSLIEKIAFEEARLHKIYTYAFDLRPRLYVALCNAGYKEEARLKQHCYFEGKYLDVLIHSKWNAHA